MKAMKMMFVFALLASGCSIAANVGKPAAAPTRASPAPTHSDGAAAAPSTMLEVPDVVWQSEQEARATLAAAGHTGKVRVRDDTCPPTQDDRVVEMGVVCYQHPPAGRRQGSRLPIEIKVQKRER